jgi:polysaccharide pyruvyl transferase WcaK-like protein
VIGGSATFDLKRIAELSQYMQAMHEHGFSVTVLVGANDHPAEDDRNLITALKQQPFSDWQLFTADSLEDWIRCLASASLLVSGRFHYTIAAAFLQIPCVVLESCTLKNQALAECFGLEAPLEYDDEHFSQELQARTERALANGTVDLSILETYRNRAMQNFDGLRSVVGNPP